MTVNAQTMLELADALDGIVSALKMGGSGNEVWMSNSDAPTIQQAATALRFAASPALAGVEAVAWRYELAHVRDWTNGKPGVYTDWHWQVSTTKPKAGEAIRNLIPLFAALAQEVPAQGPLVPWELRCLKPPEACTAPECDCPLADQPQTQQHPLALIDAASKVIDAYENADDKWELPDALRDLDLEVMRAKAAPPQCALRAAAERVCWFDWSDNDMDARAAIDALRKAVTDTRPESEAPNGS